MEHPAGGARVGGSLYLNDQARAQLVAVIDVESASVYRGTLVSAAIESGGFVSIDRGSALRLVVSGGGLESLYAGAAISTTVLSGGLQEVDGGGALAYDTVVSAGGTAEVSHGTLTSVTLAAGGTIDLGYASFSSGATVTINSQDLLTIVEGGYFHDQTTLQMAGSYTGERFSVTSGSSGSTLVTRSAAAAAASLAAVDLVSSGDYAVISATAPHQPLPGGGAAAILPVEGEPMAHMLPHIS